MTETVRTLIIRPFEPLDRAALQELWDRVFAGDPAWHGLAGVLEAQLKAPPEVLLVGLWQGRLVGAVVAAFDGVSGWIHHLAVAPAHRRRRIGTQLVRAAEAALEARGCNEFKLQVGAANAAAIAFSRSLGYEVDRITVGEGASSD